MSLAEFAAAARAMADRAEAELALEVAQKSAKELLAAMFITTPVLSGDLRDSERIQAVTGNGVLAVAKVGPDGSVVYDKFRNDGGTITSHGSWPLRNKATGQVFGHSVTQQGSHYMERAEDEARPMVAAIARMVVDEFVRL